MQDYQPYAFTRTYCPTVLSPKTRKVQGSLSVNLKGQVVTSRGQILVSRTGDNTLRVLCCALCVVCAVGVQCVCVGVCVFVLVLVCHADLHLHPLHPTPLTMCTSRVYIRNVSGVYRHHARKCYHWRASCPYTRRRIEKRGFPACHTTPHRTHTPRPQKHTHKRQQQPPQHTETGTERETEKEEREHAEKMKD